MKPSYTIILFYKFIGIRSPEKLRAEQKALCESLNLKGRFLIAQEGINATLEGETRDIKKYMRALRAMPRFKDIVFKQSVGTGNGFSKLQVKVRPEVVTLGAGKLNIKKDTAKAITPAELERLYKKDEDFVVLDLRNQFEIDAGKFEKTVSPELQNFRDLPAKLKSLKGLKHKKVVTVCTGGIRCEKATCLLKEEGFTDLYQLKDGIHAYMQKYPNRNFKGSLFVFDNRMTTPIVDTVKHEVIGACAFCSKPCEDFYNDDSTRPSTKVICCEMCIASCGRHLRSAISG
jgi:UPF0176 protein